MLAESTSAYNAIYNESNLQLIFHIYIVSAQSLPILKLFDMGSSFTTFQNRKWAYLYLTQLDFILSHIYFLSTIYLT